MGQEKQGSVHTKLCLDDRSGGQGWDVALLHPDFGAEVRLGGLVMLGTISPALKAPGRTDAQA